MNLFRLPCGIPWGGARRLVLTLACLFALSGLSAQNVTLRFERAKLKTVMDEITRQCDLSFAYSREVVDADRIVSIDLKDAPIDAALQSLFPSGNGIDYAIKNRKILLSAGKQALHVDTVVSGRVADDQNRPLVGATVVVAGTSQGTTTDLDGNFSLRVNAVDPVLKVDYLGYEPQELRVSPSQTTFDIRLALSSKAIDDVVVVGYGTVKRRDLVGAVDQVDRKVIEDRSTGTLARALQGQLPGLNITFTDSKPTRGASVNVRGSGSIGAGGSTLVLIDGVEGSINAINPQDETFRMAREGGVTCVSTGPGSSNVIGGTFCIIKTYGNRVDDMTVREKAAMKIAFGENPKNCYKEKGVYSRMSVAAKLREVLQKTIIYDKKLREAGCETSWNEINRGSGEGQGDISKMPAYDAKLDARRWRRCWNARSRRTFMRTGRMISARQSALPGSSIWS